MNHMTADPGTPISQSDEFAMRKAKLHQIRNLGIIPFAQGFDRTHTTADVLRVSQENTLRALDSISESPNPQISVAGRIILRRGMGGLMFMKLQDGHGEIQLMFSKKRCTIVDAKGVPQESVGEFSAFKFAEKMLDIADFIGVKGEAFRTQKGELTVFVTEFTLLSKAVRPLPEKWSGLTDTETLYRQRYLDLVTNNETYQRFLLRSKFTKALRDFYEEEGFIEVETPVLGNSASGAAAKPFSTHHNDYDVDVFLRISPETSLKMTTVGRFERVFEIARDFRNEGSDPSHLQEFTMVEHYAAYWSFKDNMEFVERMIGSLFSRLNLPNVIQIEDKEGKVRDVDFGKAWERIDYAERILEVTGIDIRQYAQGQESEMRAAIRAAKVEIPDLDKLSLAVMVDYLYKKKVRPYIIGPAFLYNYPKYMQPLARASDTDPNTVEQFQVLINGWEVIKSYSELVDPVDQRDRFEEQAKAIAAGDEEATSADYDFVRAMEHGMPCQSGLGFGIDRFLALITRQKNLRDVVLFPLLKPSNFD